MNTYLDCLPCLMNQALRAARAATDDAAVQWQVVNAIAAMIPELSLGLKPTEFAQRGYRLISQITGNHDPFYKAKVDANQMAMALYPRLKKLVADSEDALLTACKLAIAGNSIDLGPDFEQADINHIINETLSSPLTINDYEKLRTSLDGSRRILYLGDNAGEIVFDRVLIEELHQVKETDIYFVVRERPVINDATLDDALAMGMDRVARVVSSGSDAPATILSQCSAELQQLYRSADIITAKGQGNYESLKGESGNIFFLLRVKCPVVAKLLSVEIGNTVLKQHQLTTSKI